MGQKMGQALNVKYEVECRLTLYTPT